MRLKAKRHGKYSGHYKNKQRQKFKMMMRFSQPISTLNISQYAISVLNSHCIFRLYQLVQLTESRTKELSGIGKGSLRDIMHELKKANYSLGMKLKKQTVVELDNLWPCLYGNKS